MTEAQLSLAEQIDRDLKQAMRERDDVAKLTLRSVKTALTEAAKSGQQHAERRRRVGRHPARGQAAARDGAGV